MQGIGLLLEELLMYPSPALSFIRLKRRMVMIKHWLILILKLSINNLFFKRIGGSGKVAL